MRAPILRTIVAGLAGGVAMNIAMFVTFRVIGFGNGTRGVLLNPSMQSEKLIAVWTRIEPLPVIVSHPFQMAIVLTTLTIIHAFVYRWLAPAWPSGIVGRAGRMGLLLFVLSFLFFEVFTPFNLFHEPLPLVMLELVFWAIVAFAESSAIAWVIE
jgi:hypothetical protein